MGDNRGDNGKDHGGNPGHDPDNDSDKEPFNPSGSDNDNDNDNFNPNGSDNDSDDDNDNDNFNPNGTENDDDNDNDIFNPNGSDNGSDDDNDNDNFNPNGTENDDDNDNDTFNPNGSDNGSNDDNDNDNFDPNATENDDDNENDNENDPDNSQFNVGGDGTGTTLVPPDSDEQGQNPDQIVPDNPDGAEQLQKWANDQYGREGEEEGKWIVLDDDDVEQRGSEQGSIQGDDQENNDDQENTGYEGDANELSLDPDQDQDQDQEQEQGEEQGQGQEQEQEQEQGQEIIEEQGQVQEQGDEKENNQKNAQEQAQGGEQVNEKGQAQKQKQQGQQQQKQKQQRKRQQQKMQKKQKYNAKQLQIPQQINYNPNESIKNLRNERATVKQLSKMRQKQQKKQKQKPVVINLKHAELVKSVKNENKNEKQSASKGKEVPKKESESEKEETMKKLENFVKGASQAEEEGWIYLDNIENDENDKNETMRKEKKISNKKKSIHQPSNEGKMIQNKQVSKQATVLLTKQETMSKQGQQQQQKKTKSASAQLKKSIYKSEEEKQTLMKQYRQETGRRPLYNGKETRGFLLWLQTLKQGKDELKKINTIKSKPKEKIEGWEKLLRKWIFESVEENVPNNIKLALLILIAQFNLIRRGKKIKIKSNLQIQIFKKLIAFQKYYDYNFRFSRRLIYSQRENFLKHLVRLTSFYTIQNPNRCKNWRQLIKEQSETLDKLINAEKTSILKIIEKKRINEGDKQLIASILSKLPIDDLIELLGYGFNLYSQKYVRWGWEYNKRTKKKMIASFLGIIATDQWGVIYKITNLINNKVYIGQTIQKLNERLNKHLEFARNGANYHLYHAMRHYGSENFEIEIIESVKEEKLNEREKYWIAHYDSTNRDKGYNMNEGGNSFGQGEDNPIYVKVDKETIKRLIKEGLSREEILKQLGISKNTLNRRIYQFWGMSLKQARKHLMDEEEMHNYLKKLGKLFPNYININEEMLKNMIIEGLSAEQIASKLGVHISTIIERTKLFWGMTFTEAKKSFIEPRLKSLIRQMKTDEQIAEELDISIATVYRYVKKMLGTSSLIKARKILFKPDLEKLIMERKTQQEIANSLGISVPTVHLWIKQIWGQPMSKLWKAWIKPLLKSYIIKGFSAKEIAELLKIDYSTVLKFTKEFWNVSFSEAKSFFT